MSLVGCFGSQVWTADNRGELRRRRQGRRCGLLAASLLALLGSVTGVEYIDRECALDRQVSNVCSINPLTGALKPQSNGTIIQQYGD